jgi:hypothetical protein
MKKALLVASIVSVAVVAAGVRGTAADRVRTPDTVAGRFDGGAGSQRQLIHELLEALEAKDANALRRLRVSETEYRNIIIPGNVPPGQPPRTLTPHWLDYAWANLETRSSYSELSLLQEFGGHKLAVKDVSFDKGEKQYAGYTAYRQLRLTVEDSDGAQRVLRTGSIAQVGGRFKFISLIRD